MAVKIPNWTLPSQARKKCRHIFLKWKRKKNRTNTYLFHKIREIVILFWKTLKRPRAQILVSIFWTHFLGKISLHSAKYAQGALNLSYRLVSIDRKLLKYGTGNVCFVKVSFRPQLRVTGRLPFCLLLPEGRGGRHSFPWITPLTHDPSF